MKTTFARILRAVADAIEPPPVVAPTAHARRVVIVDAPAGTAPPPPFEAQDDGVDRLNQQLAALYLRDALRRYSPTEETKYA